VRARARLSTAPGRQLAASDLPEHFDFRSAWFGCGLITLDQARPRAAALGRQPSGQGRPLAATAAATRDLGRRRAPQASCP
jgi:hypothetical protein